MWHTIFRLIISWLLVVNEMRPAFIWHNGSKVNNRLTELAWCACVAIAYAIWQHRCNWIRSGQNKLHTKLNGNKMPRRHTQRVNHFVDLIIDVFYQISIRRIQWDLMLYIIRSNVAMLYIIYYYIHISLSTCSIDRHITIFKFVFFFTFVRHRFIKTNHRTHFFMIQVKSTRTPSMVTSTKIIVYFYEQSRWIKCIWFVWLFTHLHGGELIRLNCPSSQFVAIDAWPFNVCAYFGLLTAFNVTPFDEIIHLKINLSELLQFRSVLIKQYFHHVVF